MYMIQWQRVYAQTDLSQSAVSHIRGVKLLYSMSTETLLPARGHLQALKELFKTLYLFNNSCSCHINVTDASLSDSLTDTHAYQKAHSDEVPTKARRMSTTSVS